MSKGLITRIGEWIDNKWKAKALEEDVLAIAMKHDKQIHDLDVWHKGIEASHFEKIEGLQDAVHRMAERLEADKKLLESLSKDMRSVSELLNTPSLEAKELADLKSRFEKLELYLGMSRKVDPTKPAVAKSAFAM